jgi:hypothetical protein
MDILIYVPKITPRINYTFRQVCRRILGFNISFTTKIETFIGFKGVKFSYANQRLGNEIFIQAHGLLNEQGVNDIEISVSEWEGELYFLKTSNQSDIPYDIFAASFYLLTRYEEYLPHVKNNIGDYPAQESLGYNNNFLTKPIVNIWMKKFADVLAQKFEDVDFAHQNSNLKLIVAVERAYKYRKYGISRTIFGFLSDIFKLKLKDVFIRVKTWFKPKTDPYDVYNEIIKYKNKLGFEIFFMFQLGDYSIYTKNINFRKRIYKKLIKSMGDYCETGLMPSWEAIQDFNIFKKEIKRFEQIANHELTNIMIKDRGLNFPEFYVSLDKTDIKHDFSMGYYNELGFRAGTYTPFLFYDLNLEQASPIQFHPYFCSTRALKSENDDKLKMIIEENKKFNIQYNILVDNTDFEKDELKIKTLNLIKLILND